MSLSPLKYGTVKGRFIAAVADTTNDVDDEPDAIPLTGKVTFRPDVQAILVGNGSEAPATVMPAPITAQLDSQGYLTLNGQRGVKLIATDNVEANPTNFTYTVELDIRYGSTPVKYPGWSIQVPADQETDLTLQGRVPSASGTAIIRGASVTSITAANGVITFGLSDSTSHQVSIDGALVSSIDGKTGQVDLTTVYADINNVVNTVDGETGAIDLSAKYAPFDVLSGAVTSLNGAAGDVVLDVDSEITVTPDNDGAYIVGEDAVIQGLLSDKTLPAAAKSNLAEDFGSVATATGQVLAALFAPALVGNKEPVREDSQMYNVLKWGAFGNGTANNDTAGVQAAINAAHASGGGIVFFPKRDYSISQLRLKSKVTLMGAGWGTRLIQRTGTTGHLLILDTISTEHTRVCNLQLHGNKENQTAANDALHFDNTGGSFSFYDANHIIENVLVYIPKRHGFYLSANSRESKLINCFVTGADGSGYVLNATDSVATNCVTGAAGGTGMILAGPNSRVVGCKSFGSGRLNVPGNRNGFDIRAKRISLSACEAQDNAEHGFNIFNMTGGLITLSGCIADSNGRLAIGAGFKITGSSAIALNGCLSFDREVAPTQRYGLSFGGTNSDIQVSIQTANNTHAPTEGTPAAPFHLVVNSIVRTAALAPNGTPYVIGVNDAGAVVATTI